MKASQSQASKCYSTPVSTVPRIQPVSWAFPSSKQNCIWTQLSFSCPQNTLACSVSFTFLKQPWYLLKDRGMLPKRLLAVWGAFILLQADGKGKTNKLRNSVHAGDAAGKIEAMSNKYRQSAGTRFIFNYNNCCFSFALEGGVWGSRL